MQMSSVATVITTNEHVPPGNEMYVPQRYYEHPLSAVTSAMLNISSAAQNCDTMRLMEEGAGEPPVNTNMNNNIQITNPHQLHQIHSSNGTSYVFDYYKISEKDCLQWR